MRILSTENVYSFEAKCNKCGCEFEFDIHDLKETLGTLFTGNYILECPYCKKEYKTTIEELQKMLIDKKIRKVLGI